MTVKRVTVSKLAELVEGEVVGDGDKIISGFNSLEEATDEQMSFLAKLKDKAMLEESKAGAVIVPAAFTEDCGVPIIKVKNPYLAGAKIHSFLLETDFVAEGIHPRAYVGEHCKISDQVTIKQLASIGDRVTIGERTVIHPGVVIGDDVIIGDDCDIRANVVIESTTVIGDRVLLYPGVVIGSDGFGYATDERGVHHRRPQTGRVVIGNDVDVGANSCVDCAAYGVTELKDGVKIDNQVQIGHNVEVGEHSMLIAQTGLAGSTIVGRHVVMGGKCATAGHQKIGNMCMIAAGSGVVGDLADGSVVSGRPAIPMKQWRKAVTVFGKLPEMYKEIKSLKNEINSLKDDE